MPLDIIINSGVAAGLILVVFLYFMSKRSTIATKNPEVKKTAKVSNFAGIEEAVEPGTIIRHPKELPEPSEAFLSFELVREVTTDKQHNLIDSATSLKKPHPLLLSLTRDINDPQVLLDIIKNDPELVVRVIKIANSSLFGSRKAITTINHAVVYLGILQAKNVAMQFALERSVEFVTKEQKQAYHKIWKASFLASSIGLLIAKDLKLDNSAELSTRCLLDYLGDISLLTARPKIAKYYLNHSNYLNRVSGIQKELNANSAIMGRAFAKNAELPDEIIQSLGASMLPLVNKLDDTELSHEQQVVVTFCYYVCRITDMIVFESKMNNIDLEEISFPEARCESFYYSEDQIDKYGLGKINSTLRNAKFKRDVGAIISKLGLDSDA